MKKITIVGAGPGDPELITVKGLKAIQSADVILYDALSGDELLQFARPDAQLIYVGKRCEKHSLKQQDINHLIAQSARSASQVVRLKGGDPFVFGRGYEELDYLRSRGFRVEVIPGISSVTSLSALQSVPLTSRNVSESFWVLTGTTQNHQLSSDISIAIGSSATLVILMGIRKLNEICDLLTSVGRRDESIMIIQNGSRQDEKVTLGSASDICQRLHEGYEKDPGIIIIGKVVELHPDFIHQKALQEWV